MSADKIEFILTQMKELIIFDREATISVLKKYAPNIEDELKFKNELKDITVFKKEGFFTRNQPKFEVNDGELDVSNKSKVFFLAPGISSTWIINDIFFNNKIDEI